MALHFSALPGHCTSTRGAAAPVHTVPAVPSIAKSSSRSLRRCPSQATESHNRSGVVARVIIKSRIERADADVSVPTRGARLRAQRWPCKHGLAASRLWAQSACLVLRLQIEKVLFTTEQLNEILDDLGRQVWASVAHSVLFPEADCLRPCQHDAALACSVLGMSAASCQAFLGHIPRDGPASEALLFPWLLFRRRIGQDYVSTTMRSLLRLIRSRAAKNSFPAPSVSFSAHRLTLVLIRRPTSPS